MPDIISQVIAKDALNIPLPLVRAKGQFRTANNAHLTNSKFVNGSSDYTRYLKQLSSFRK